MEDTASSRLNTGEHNFSHIEMQGKIYKSIIGFLNGPANGILALDQLKYQIVIF
ncbi:hypothetical protein ACLB1N_01820 [Escherichia coli]